jgi:hypothetical protein
MLWRIGRVGLHLLWQEQQFAPYHYHYQCAAFHTANCCPVLGVWPENTQYLLASTTVYEACTAVRLALQATHLTGVIVCSP